MALLTYHLNNFTLDDKDKINSNIYYKYFFL